MAAVPPAASCALATRLMVTKLVNDWASGVVSRTRRTAAAMFSRIGESDETGVPVVQSLDEPVNDDALLLITAPYDGLNQQVLRVRLRPFSTREPHASSPALRCRRYAPTWTLS